ncbi:CAP domain-containing protein [Gracilibacillus alcaliphilus]|uniref:CAP domain-containing protein n=1 Tax=Gracilibacillus alcaliphilus TaxID=1401441 RepID=UPI00195B2D67|nr:CAP domain-containing protein [Gracilibacillus alcaliphilus]MBM7676585.1 putative YkwD family protein [Gracilibacillus alcaliphilus]
MNKKVVTGIILTGAVTIAAGFSADNVAAQSYEVKDVQSNVSVEQHSESNIQDVINRCAISFPTGQWQQEQAEQGNAPQAEQEEGQASAPEQPQAEETTSEAPEKSADENQQAGELSQFEEQVVDLTNQEREKQGLAPLEADAELSKVAKAKSEDMAKNGYFDHNSPTYGSPFDMMKQFGISYQTAGENIAKGQRSPEEVVDAWMNSEGHRANILSSDFTHIGVGYVENGNVWTQQFIGK